MILNIEQNGQIETDGIVAIGELVVPIKAAGNLNDGDPAPEFRGADQWRFRVDFQHLHDSGFMHHATEVLSFDNAAAATLARERLLAAVRPVNDGSTGR